MRITYILAILISGFIFLSDCGPILAQDRTFSTSSADIYITDPGAVELGDSLIPPTSPLYFLKTWREGIELALTRSAEGKVVRQLEFAQRRLRDIKSLLKAKNEDEIVEMMYNYHLHIEAAQNIAVDSPDLQVKIGESIARHMYVLESFHLAIANPEAKFEIRRALLHAALYNRNLLTTLDENRKKNFIPLIIKRQQKICEFLLNQSKNQELKGSERELLETEGKACQDSLNSIEEK